MTLTGVTWLAPLAGGTIDGVTDPQQIRIGNTERDAALTSLGNHMRAGRLTPDEYSARAGLVTNAVHRTDLNAVFSDLPGGGPTGAMAPLVATGPSSYPAPAPSYPESGGAVAQPAAAPVARGSGTNWVAIAGPVGLVLFFVCGFVFNGWAWSWLFFMLPALFAVIGTNARRR